MLIQTFSATDEEKKDWHIKNKCNHWDGRSRDLFIGYTRKKRGLDRIGISEGAV